MLPLRRLVAIVCLALTLLGVAQVRAAPLSAAMRGAVIAPPGWQDAIYGGAGRLPAGIPGYSLAFPPRWTARLWPDTLAGYGQLDLYSPAGSTLDLVLLPLRPGGPTLAAVLAHDRAFLSGATQDVVTLPLGTAVRLSGRATPAGAGMASQILYLVRYGFVYRFFFAQPVGVAARSALLQIAASLRVPPPEGGPSRVPLAPPLPPAEICCHCPAWGAGWGTVLTRVDGVPVYWNAGDVDNGCVGTYGIPYQCVELVQRYFAVRWGYPDMWRGVATAADMRWIHPSDVQFISNGGSPGPREGDAVVFYGGAVGHVALVRSVDRAHGLIALVEENWSPTGAAMLPLYGDNTIGIRDSAYGSYTVAGWLHSPKNV